MRIMNKVTRIIVPLVLLTIISCARNNDSNNGRKLENIELNFEKKKRTVKSEKKGIEFMAEYQSEIRKEIGAEKSKYKPGYLVEEFQKAQENLARRRNSNRGVNAVFTERGPNNVPGRTRATVVDPTDSNKWYAGTVGGGVWRTTDGGTTWSNLTDNQVPNLATSTIDISQNSPNTLYVGTGEPFGNLGAIGGSGVYKTTDGGTTWTHLVNTTSFGDVGRLVINPTNVNHVVVASRNGVFVTFNGGASWSQTFSGGNVQDLDATPGNFNTLYGSVNSVGLIKSTNGGTTWSTVFNTSSVNSNHARFETTTSEVNPNLIITCAYSNSDGGTQSADTDLYISRDAGASFINLTSSQANTDLIDLVGGQGWYDNIVLAHPFDENVFYVGGVELFKVTVNSNSFTAQAIAATQQNGNLNQVNTGVHVDQHGLTVLKGSGNDFRLILSNDGGVFFSNDSSDPGVNNGDWSSSALGKNSTQFYGADKRNGSDDYLAGAQDNGSWISTSGTSTVNTSYSRVSGGDGFEVIWHYNNPQDFISTSQFNRFFRFTNFSGILSPFPATGPFYTKVSNVNNNPSVVFTVNSNGVWRSTDFAGSWELTSINETGFGGFGNSSSLNVDVSIANPDIVWTGVAMTESGSFNLFVSEDNGLSFTEANSYSPGNGHNFRISGIATSPINENRAYALFSAAGAAKIVKTNDLGQTWSDISGFEQGEDRGFPDVAVHSLLEMPFDENIIWAGTDIGIFETIDGGNSWTIISDFIPVAVYDMKIVNNQIVIATYGRGVWSATLTELSGYEPSAYIGVAQISSLQQENKEGLSVVATYQVPSDDIDRVKLFVNGNEVAEIIDNFQGNTNYQFQINDLTNEGQFEFGVQGFDDDNSASTITTTAKGYVIDFEETSRGLLISEFVDNDAFTFDGDFVINDLGGDIASPALNNQGHPYANSRTYTTVLKTPIRIASSDNVLRYEDFAITEVNFDFVFIEASTDLVNWQELDRYDANRFSDWRTQHDIIAGGGNATITDDLFKEQSINLSNFFNENDEVVLRFRFVTDVTVTSYGWAIRSLRFNENTLSVNNAIANGDFSLYPSISDGNFTVKRKNAIENSQLRIYDLTGKEVFNKELNFVSNQTQSISTNLRSGVYVVHIKGESNERVTRKIIIK